MSTTALVATKTVVVADDTAFVRDRFQTALEDGGYRAIVIRSGSELLRRLRADLNQIDLVLLDLRLPQSHGVELIRALRKIDPIRPKIVVFSGTIATADEVHALAGLNVAGYVNEYMAVRHILHALTPHLFADRPDRRSSPRVVLGIPVSYRYGNTIANGVTLNVGRGGMAIRTTSPLDVGTIVKTRFRLPSGKMEIDGESCVRWIDRRLGMGLQFVQIDPASQTALDAFVQSHFFSNRKA
jgi:uncharacterized protein (TIGR02266 family)